MASGGPEKGISMLSRFSPYSKRLETGMARHGRARAGEHVPRQMLAILLLLGLPVAAQSPGMPPQSAPNTGGIMQRDSDGLGAPDIDARMEARRLVALNQQRQHQMVSDAGKLLKLAQELSADADAGGTILSSAERMQKASEIEKLARNVRQKMTYAIGAPQEPLGPTAPWQR